MFLNIACRRVRIKEAKRSVNFGWSRSFPTSKHVPRLLRLSRAHFWHRHLWQALLYSILLVQVSVYLYGGFCDFDWRRAHCLEGSVGEEVLLYNWSLPQTHPSTIQMGIVTNCPKNWCWQITLRNITLPISSLFNLIILHISSSSFFTSFFHMTEDPVDLNSFFPQLSVLHLPQTYFPVTSSDHYPVIYHWPQELSDALTFLSSNRAYHDLKMSQSNTQRGKGRGRGSATP